MTTLLIVLVVWVIVSFPACVLMGRLIKNGHGYDDEYDEDRRVVKHHH